MSSRMRRTGVVLAVTGVVAVVPASATAWTAPLDAGPASPLPLITGAGGAGFIATGQPAGSPLPSAGRVAPFSDGSLGARQALPAGFAPFMRLGDLQIRANRAGALLGAQPAPRGTRTTLAAELLGPNGPAGVRRIATHVLDGTLALSRDGRPVVTYVTCSDKRCRHRALRVYRNGSRRVIVRSARLTHPVVGVDSAGHVHLAWADGKTVRTMVVGRRAMTIGHLHGRALGELRIAVSRRGDTAVAWTTIDEVACELADTQRVVLWRSGHTARTLATWPSSTCSSLSPVPNVRLAYDTKLVVAWTTAAAGASYVQVKDGNQKPRTVGRIADISAQLDDLAVDERGKIQVLWSQDRRQSGAAIPLIATALPGGPDAMLDVTSDAPQASLTATGNGFAAAWTRGGEARVAFG